MTPIPPTVFVGSTFADLELHRELVLKTLAMLKAFVEAMEYFGALDGAPLSECLKAVKRADTYVGIVGTRYGSVDEAGVSITQREYEAAYASEKSIFIFLIDEQRHPVLPKFVDFGPKADRLRAFRELLQQRHVYASFESPQDLALKVGVTLIRRFLRDAECEHAEQKFAAKAPRLLAQAGYSIGMRPIFTPLGAALSVGASGELAFSDQRMRMALSAAHYATALADGKFGVLDDVMTFGHDFWPFLTGLVRVMGVGAKGLPHAIRTAPNPVRFRLLVILAGSLPQPEAVPAICEVFLRRYSFQREYNELAGQATRSIADVVRTALSAMPATCVPILEKYLSEARQLKRWPQKRLFEEVAAKLSRASAA